MSDRPWYEEHRQVIYLFMGGLLMMSFVGAHSFLELSDTPINYSTSGYYVQINSSGDGLDFVTKIAYAPMGEIYIDNNSLSTVITSPNTWSRVNGGNWVTNNNTDGFTPYANGTLLYNNTQPVFTHVAVTLSVTSSGANDVIRAGVFKNGALLPNSQIQLKLRNIGDVSSTAIHVAPVLVQGDVLDLRLLNEASSNDLTVTYANLFAMGMRP